MFFSALLQDHLIDNMLAWEKTTACREVRDTLSHGYLGSWCCCLSRWAVPWQRGPEISAFVGVESGSGTSLAIRWIGLSTFLLAGLSLFQSVQGSQNPSWGGQQMEDVVHATVTVWLMWWLQAKLISQERYVIVKDGFCQLSLSLSDTHTPWGGGQGCLPLRKGQE